MQHKTNTAPKVIPATAPPTAEHRKASHSGEIAFGWGTAFLLFSGLSALGGYYGIALALAGVFVGMLVVGVMFHYEGERQRQRADSSPPRLRSSASK
jgi:hypothetical protein